MTERQDALHAVINELCEDNNLALDFCHCLLHMIAVYDDLIDGDKVSEQDIHLVFEIGTIRLPQNAFYRQHFAALAPYILSAIRNWRIANGLEDQNETSEDLRIAFVLRSSYVDVFTTVALLLHGPEASIDWGIRLRRAAADETYVAYAREHTREA